jgi:NADPH-dependent curcumin reductase CurA
MHTYKQTCVYTLAQIHIDTSVFTHTFFTLPARVHTGKLKYTEDIREGLEIYPSTVRMLTSGENKGKLILKV